MNDLGKGLCLLIGLLALCSCGQREGLAPVVELKWRTAHNHARQHIVERGETLYAIAFRYDQDYRQLATANYLRSPYTLHVGQILRLKSTSIRTQPMAPRRYQPPPRYSKPVWHARNQPRIVEPRPQYNGWLWPVRGKVVARYAPQQGKKGIDIAGRKGEKIRAANGGVVAYAGNGLSGYGNLIIIKHQNQYLTAYGNNLRNLVREGQQIQAGQVIAEIGVVDRRYWGVHFEIRRAGKPENPLNYLKRVDR